MDEGWQKNRPHLFILAPDLVALNFNNILIVDFIKIPFDDEDGLITSRN